MSMGGRGRNGEEGKKDEGGGRKTAKILNNPIQKAFLKIVLKAFFEDINSKKLPDHRILNTLS